MKAAVPQLKLLLDYSSEAIVVINEQLKIAGFTRSAATHFLRDAQADYGAELYLQAPTAENTGIFEALLLSKTTSSVEVFSRLSIRDNACNLYHVVVTSIMIGIEQLYLLKLTRIENYLLSICTTSKNPSFSPANTLWHDCLLIMFNEHGDGSWSNQLLPNAAKLTLNEFSKKSEKGYTNETHGFSEGIDWHKITDGEFCRGKVDLPYSTGEYKNFEVCIFKLKPVNSNYRFGAVCIEISKHVQEVRSLRATGSKCQQLLNEVNGEMQALAYSISHDLRAPLRAVNGYSRILSEDYGPVLEHEGNRIINLVMENAARSITLMDGLLTYSKVAGTPLKHTRLNMNELFNEVMDEIRHESGNTLNIQLFSLLEVYADRELIKIVLVQILRNAIKFTSKNSDPVVIVSSTKRSKDHVYQVEDNGAGFEMKYSDKLFGMFQRLHSTEEFEGNGTGLAIVKRIITKHQGDVWAKGTPGKGSTFYFTIPIQADSN